MKVLYDLVSGVPGVRLAEKKDEADLFMLLLMLHKENGMFGLNEDKVMNGIRWATERQGGIIFVIDYDSHVIASLGMVVTSDWYSDDCYLLERWNYVHPDHRRSDYARRLIDQGKWAHAWFKKQNVHMPFQCGINSFDRTEAKVRLYARIMPCIGAFFMWGAPPVLYQAEKYRRALAEIEEINQRVRGLPRHERSKTTPLVETILRVGTRDV